MTNTPTREIVLPPLPEPEVGQTESGLAIYNAFQLDAYARAAVEADREAGRSAPREPMYLVMAGGDGFQSSIVPASKLDEAYLLTQWMDLECVKPDDRAEALEHFHDDEQWTHTDVTGNGERLEFEVSFEDGWVKVIRLFDVTPLYAGSAPVVEPATDVALRAKVADLLHLLQFATIETPTMGDVSQAVVIMDELRDRLSGATHAPSSAVAASPDVAKMVEKAKELAEDFGRELCSDAGRSIVACVEAEEAAREKLHAAIDALGAAATQARRGEAVAQAHALAEEAKTAWGRQDPSRLWTAIEALEVMAAFPKLRMTAAASEPPEAAEVKS